MTVTEALKKRKSVRKFLDKLIPEELLVELFEAAKWAPSSKNTQPWKIAVVSGEKKEKLMNKILKAHKEGQKPRMEYKYDGERLEDELKQRAIKCGQDLYNALEIAQDDKDGRLQQWAKNYLSFKSPTAIFIFKHPDTGISGYIDCGMLIQSIMLAAVDLGLATCPQASLAHYPDIVKEELGYKDDVLLCGIAIGYEDVQDKVNNYRTERENLNNIVNFFREIY
ncbi:nitroreductase [Allofrancisella guangzhouensis]|uniref:NADH dehydrogenase n=1 Tax=Allofrancisella guangzhouensis TaxID=594679 RepID=A0A0A8E5M7_9GAMM|nr:nitroreductase [Allofrancisella guangzhouensis]AJC49515.1 NADH dehydrogenase [Allofrancisella guangzhouensis]MBK2026589.1 nitroreductase [Allofrancisella guangzhouensis]MBK2044333.1 nitroreductase [Allofrancisella guangzhouensis]MBK2045576.1 nitroreductase [Allofrancisella guangzhouensis]